MATPAKATVTEEYPVTNTQKVRRNIEGRKEMDIVRSAPCPDHGRISSDYAGENEHGWIFRCTGLTPGEAKEKHAKVGLVLFPEDVDPSVPSQAHYFTAAPE